LRRGRNKYIKDNERNPVTLVALPQEVARVYKGKRGKGREKERGTRGRGKA
jgi:hypothetical protein